MTIRISPKLNESLTRLEKLPFAMTKVTPKKDKNIPKSLLWLGLSFRIIILKSVVIIGLEAAIKDEFIAVVCFIAIKNKTWYPNIPTIPVNKK